MEETQAPPPAPHRLGPRHARRRWYVRPVLVILAVTAVAAGLRFYHLSTPHEYVFDEVYYAKDGCYDAGFSYQACKLDHPGEQTVTVHPPLGRWIIAGGEAAFGNRPFGWRVASAIAGTLSVALLATLAYVLFRSVLWSGVAGLLLATESLNFVQSRISMLDIFVALFVVAGFLFLVLDKRWIERRAPATARPSEDLLLDLPPDRPPAPVFRPWRLACGVAMGAATATKWSGGAALAGAIVMSLGWEIRRRRDVGLPHPFWEAVRDEGFGLFAFLVVVPIAVYLASYARWFADNNVDFGGWWRLQHGMAQFSITLRATHPYASPAFAIHSKPPYVSAWILLSRPVAYYYHCFGRTTPVCQSPAEIIGIGNPIIWWGSIPALLYTAVAWLRGARLLEIGRSFAEGLLAAAILTSAYEIVYAVRAAAEGSVSWSKQTAWKGGLVVAVLAFAVFLLIELSSLGRWEAAVVFSAVAWQYVPWFFAHRTNFLFYMTPITPFMVLAFVYALKAMADARIGLDRVRALAPAATLLAAAAVGVFVFFLPVLTGRAVSYNAWHARIWFPGWV